MSAYKYHNILWLCSANFTGGIEFLLKKHLDSCDLSFEKLTLKNFTPKCLIKKSKTEFTWDKTKYNDFLARLEKFNPDFIIINDKAALGYITQQYVSLALTRSSIYKFPINGKEINCLVIDDIRKAKSTPTGSWILRQDLFKLKRWITGTQKAQPKFQYKVCQSRADLDYSLKFASESLLIAKDIETLGSGNNVTLTCDGFTCLHKSGEIKSFVIPFVDTTQSNGCYWRDASDEIYAFDTIKKLNACSVPKTMQNGSYDSTHYITYHLPVNNYIYDSMHLFHSLYIEAPKRLDFVASMTLDFYRYWKDESTEGEKDDKQEIKIPISRHGLRSYWRYNALDCYYTLLSTLRLVQIIEQPALAWAKENYLKEFALQIGPCLAGSLRGIKWNTGIQAKFNKNLRAEADAALKNLRTSICDQNFNPNSTPQVANLVYDVLGATQLPREKRKTGEPVLKLIQTQHPFTKSIIQLIWDYKKPLNNANKYGTLKLLNSRYMYKISAAGTETGRQATSSSNFWRGANVQNVPEQMRVIFEADTDYYLFDFDYSQSDAYFTAFESEDEKFMETMLSDIDTHCTHAEHFFKIPLEKLLEGKKLKESWCVHKTTGVRSVTKRVVYGANYLMAGYTLFITMGQDAVIAAGIHLGYEDAASWNHSQLIFLCTKLIESYFQMYPGLPVWIQEQVSYAIANANLVRCYGGLTRMFFKNLRQDDSGQRELAAFFGQGGTAGNINAFLLDFYFNKDKNKLKDSKDIMFLFQVHDSIVGQVHKTKLHLLPKLKAQMERECEIHGRKFIVPVEGTIGIGWGKRMIDWHPDVTHEEIKTHDKNWWKEWNKS